jgi:hypothetical protein
LAAGSGWARFALTEEHEHENITEFKTGNLGGSDRCAAISVVGFSSLGWKLDSTAQQMAANRADTAVVGVLTPICVEKFRHQANATAKLAELNKVSFWNRESVIEKGGWATAPGNDTPNSAVARACAEQLGRSL